MVISWLWQGLLTNGLSATAGAAWRRSTGGEIKIVSPREGEVAQSERREASGDNAYRVRGHLKSKSPKDEVWVLLEDESTGRVWPQERAEYVSGEWSALVWGMKKPKAKIIAVVAGSTEHDMFSYYLKNGEKTGWAPLIRLPVTIANQAFRACEGIVTALAHIAAPQVPSIIAGAGERAGIRFLEFFASTIRNPHTRRAYGRAVADFLAWCAGQGVVSIVDVQPLHVAAWIELQTREHAAPTAKLRLAALRHLFDWLVTGQVVPRNPAASVRGPAHSVRTGKTSVLDPTEARQLLDSIDVSTPIGLRDRALIGLMIFNFAPIGAALGMRVEDVSVQNRRLWVRLREKGGKRHEMPCHHTLEAYLHAYLDGTGIGADPKGWLFQTIGRGTGQLSRTALPQANAYVMVQRRALAAGIGTRIGNHSFRATGITAYLKNGGTLEMPLPWRTTPALARHSSTIGGEMTSRSMRLSASDSNLRSKRTRG